MAAACFDKVGCWFLFEVGWRLGGAVVVVVVVVVEPTRLPGSSPQTSPVTVSVAAIRVAICNMATQ